MVDLEKGSLIERIGNMGERKKVLILDDDTAILEVMRIILEDNGFEVMVKEEFTSVEAILDSVRPDIFLVDIWMKGIDGSAITKTLKTDSRTQDIPVIIVSADNDTEKIAREIGADDFLAKPFDIGALVEKVKRHTS